MSEGESTPDHYYPVMIVGSKGTRALVQKGDGSLVVNWAALRDYVKANPIDINGIMTAKDAVDGMFRCLAHAVLAMRDGRCESSGETDAALRS